ncbi:NADH-quinone oxidoreductase subunit A [Desulfurispira natronophila]|uniref:NADH-quinone oxidoreductase subunit A n=1 Tax=Desulfurispira natronophila TaxID=682562 RepID=A0A7W8DH07_9BACT|nr:NADH-quinone oxidoreductase subunit A [Desulfurispira natronophila]MBB5021768.1 NADH-quinone oxidoreductase subunit A [Desulfurispira natronophila]
MSAELVLAAVLLIGIAVLFPAIFLLTGFIGPRSGGRIKNDIYEAGVSSMVGTATQRFSVKYYLVAILFIIFDIEAVFMYPWAVSMRELGWHGFIVMLVFMLTLFEGLVYVIKKGALKWE